MRSPKHIRFMNRSALKPIVSTALIAIAAVLFWLFSVGDPCLSAYVANHWTEKNPPVTAPVPAAGSTGYVVIENPYGIMSCDYWPTPVDQFFSISVFAIVAFGIGWLTARRIPHRPLFTAAAITAAAMLFALLLQYLVRLKSITSLHSAEGLRLFQMELLLSLLFFLAASGIAMFGAWVATRSSRRV